MTSESMEDGDRSAPGHLSMLRRTDPGLIEYFAPFAFDDIPRECGLDPATRFLVQLAGLIAVQAPAQYRLTLDAALTADVSPVEIKEIVYHAVPYVGMGRVLDFLILTNDVLAERGVGLPLRDQATTTADTRAGAGLAVQKRIVGDDVVADMYANATEDEAHLQQFISANCFGDHFTRTGIDVRMRELAIFSMLVSMGGCEPQVAGHVGLNYRIGNTRSELIGVLTALLPLIGYPRTLNGLRAVDNHVPATT